MNEELRSPRNLVGKSLDRRTATRTREGGGGVKWIATPVVSERKEMLRVARNENKHASVRFHSSDKSWNKGLISVDRRTKPTLILTIPRSSFKSSTKDLSFPIFEIMIQDTHPLAHLSPAGVRPNCMI